MQSRQPSNVICEQALSLKRLKNRNLKNKALWRRNGWSIDFIKRILKILIENIWNHPEFMWIHEKLCKTLQNLKKRQFYLKMKKFKKSRIKILVEIDSHVHYLLLLFFSVIYCAIFPKIVLWNFLSAKKIPNKFRSKISWLLTSLNF